MSYVYVVDSFYNCSPSSSATYFSFREASLKAISKFKKMVKKVIPVDDVTQNEKFDKLSNKLSNLESKIKNRKYREYENDHIEFEYSKNGKSFLVLEYGLICVSVEREKIGWSFK